MPLTGHRAALATPEAYRRPRPGGECDLLWAQLTLPQVQGSRLD